MVSGKEIGKFKNDLIARNAKACDSIKSPSNAKLSIGCKLLINFLEILLSKNLFFLPPPLTRTFLTSGSALIALDIIYEVYSVSVAAPSSNDSPLMNDKSKSFIS